MNADTLNTAYILGQLAYISGISRFNNPYPVGTDEEGEWWRGWDEAKEEAERDKKLRDSS